MSSTQVEGSNPRPGSAAGSGDGPPIDPDSKEPRTPQCLDGLLQCVGILILTLYWLVLYGGLVYAQIGLWRGTGDKLVEPMTIALPGIARLSVTANTWLLILVLTSGALGSFVHAATSFADYVGNHRAERSWIVWFMLRPLIGSALALVFYVTLRGGLFASNGAESLNIYGFAAIGALTGMFSKQATDKLREVFDNLFKTTEGYGDDARQDKLK